MKDTETLCKLYLELANVVPPECVSSREIALKKQVDTYGVGLLMIANGCANPSVFAHDTLRKAGFAGKITP